MIVGRIVSARIEGVEGTEINMAPIGDVGPIGTVPGLVGICTEHGWWFEADTQQDHCPEGGCYAPVHIYVWRNENRPEDPRDD